MNITQPIFCKNHIVNNHSKNIKSEADFHNQSSINANCTKASAENFKANYMVNFKGGMRYEASSSSGIGTLNHQTAFFREPNTDEIVQNYILENFGDDKEINIVSGACATGEEAKSYAMLLDTLDSKLKIHGFDISPEIVKDAQKNSCQLIKQDSNGSIIDLISLDSENILLTDNIDNLTEYEKKCRNKFGQYYKQNGLPYKEPVFPNAKTELNNLDALLANKKEFKKQKKQYAEHIQMVKNMTPELAAHMPSFEYSINLTKRALAKQADTYRTVVDFDADEHSFDNCTFVTGDVMNLAQLYKPDSINILLYRNALYHTLCQGDNMYRYMKDDAPETMDSIAKQMNKVLKNNGLVVFGEKEDMQGINPKIIKQSMENNGFKLLQQNDKNANNNIWVKTEDIEHS